MCAMLLADMGASVLRIDRTTASGLGVPRPPEFDLVLRNRYALPLDLKRPDSVALVLDLIEGSDALIEGFRPGVAERLGLGPEPCLARNPKLVYGRMTGWGQSGPLVHAVGHDINYIALAGALHAIGRAGQPPTVPINLVGDYGGGALYLALGIVSALLETRVSGKGQIVDAAIVDGTANLLTQACGTLAARMMTHERGTNITDSGAPFYDVYECADGKWISLGAVERKFFEEALHVLELDPEIAAGQWDRTLWPSMRALISAKVKERTQSEWITCFEGVEACFAPVLTIDEAAQHPHLRERQTYIKIGDVTQPAPAPRFSRSTSSTPVQARIASGASLESALEPWLDPAAVGALRTRGTIV